MSSTKFPPTSPPPAAKSRPCRRWSASPSARVADQKHTAGYYANIIFAIAPAAIVALRTKFGLNEEVFRVIFTHSPEPKPAK